MQPDNLQTWYVILNPHAGSGKGLKDKDKIIQIIRNSGLKFFLRISEYPGHAVELAKNLANEGAVNFIVAGGDGTLNEVVNGFFNGRGSVPENIVIGMIPVGTGNDWIKTFGIPDNYEEAMKIIMKGRKVTQDAGELTYYKDNREIKRYFLNIAGIGFDGLVTSKANKLKAKGVTGFKVYARSLFSSYLHFKAKKTLIEIDGQRIEKNLFSASIGLGKYNGGGMMQVPEANPFKGIFHITLISKIGIAGILKNFRGLYDGTFVRDYRVSTYAGKEVFIKAPVPLPGEADGESLGESDFRIRILPHQVTVICGDIKL